MALQAGVGRVDVTPAPDVPAGFEPPQPFQIDNCTFTPAAAAALADAAVALLEAAAHP